MIVTAVILLFLLMVAVGFPIFVAMATAGMAGAMLLGEMKGLLQNTALGLYQSFSTFELVAIPLYILVGTLMERTQLSAKLFLLARVWFAHLPGGMAVATIMACGMFSAISGSSAATAVTIGMVALPLLTERGYRPAFSGAMIAAGGTLGILIPPSIAMIVFSIITEQSIGALFIAGVVPGILLMLLFAVYALLFARSDLPPERFTFKEKIQATWGAAGAVALPLMIFAAIYTGVATPTEVAALAVVYVLLLGIVMRRLSLRSLIEASGAAARTTVMIFLLVGCGKILTEFFTLSEVPQQAVALISQSDLSPFTVVALVILILVVLGMFLEALSMILVTVPILYPIMMTLGFDPLAFGIFMVLAVEVSLITPPVGMNLFMICSIGKISIAPMAREALVYVGLMVVLMFVILFVPEIATWLPATMK